MSKGQSLLWLNVVPRCVHRSNGPASGNHHLHGVANGCRNFYRLGVRTRPRAKTSPTETEPLPFAESSPRQTSAWECGWSSFLRCQAKPPGSLVSNVGIVKRHGASVWQIGNDVLNRFIGDRAVVDRYVFEVLQSSEMRQASTCNGQAYEVKRPQRYETLQSGHARIGNRRVLKFKSIKYGQPGRGS